MRGGRIDGPSAGECDSSLPVRVADLPAAEWAVTDATSTLPMSETREGDFQKEGA